MKLTEHEKLQTVDDILNAFITMNELTEREEILSNQVYYEKEFINSFKHVHHIKKYLRKNWRSNYELNSIITIYHNTLTKEIKVIIDADAINASMSVLGEVFEYSKTFKKYADNAISFFNKEHDKFIELSIDKEEKLCEFLIDMQELIYI